MHVGYSYIWKSAITIHQLLTILLNKNEKWDMKKVI